MAECTLSTGQMLLSEDIQRVEFYPSGSFPYHVLINGVSASPEEDFLYIHSTNGPSSVRGTDGSQDVTALEQAGVRVARRRIKPSVLAAFRAA
jgi:hypothetical protein